MTSLSEHDDDDNAFLKEEPHGMVYSLSQEEKLNVIDASKLTIPQIEEQDAKLNRAIELFFNNQYDSVQKLLAKEAGKDPLYSLGDALMAMIPALSTFDPEDIRQATEKMKKAELLASHQYDLATPRAKGSGFLKIIKDSADYIAQTTGFKEAPLLNPVQLRAEVLRSETALCTSLLYIFSESISGFIRAGFSIRRSHHSLDHAWQNYHKYMNTNQDIASKIDKHTLSGIFLGIGGINLILSLLPALILKLLAVLGFHGNKKLGIQLLSSASEINGLRSPFAAISLAGYYGILGGLESTVCGPSMIRKCAKLIGNELRKYPRSPPHLLLLGRVLRCTRDLEASSKVFLLAHQAQKELKGLISLCECELAVSAMLSLDWKRAAMIWGKLKMETNWTKAFFTFVEGACLEMVGEHSNAVALFKQAPKLIFRKFAGKTISLETYVAKKLKIYEGREFRTYLPGLELLALLNVFPCMPFPLLNQCKMLVQENIDAAMKNGDTTETQAMLYFILGTIELASQKYENASLAFDWVIEQEKEIKMELFIVPFSVSRKALVLLLLEKDVRQGVQVALSTLKDAAAYSNYCHETILQFWIKYVSEQLQEFLNDPEFNQQWLIMPSKEEISDISKIDFNQ